MCRVMRAAVLRPVASGEKAQVRDAKLLCLFGVQPRPARSDPVEQMGIPRGSGASLPRGES